MSGLFKIHWGTLGSKWCSSFDILRDMKKQNVTAVKSVEKTQWDQIFFKVVTDFLFPYIRFLDFFPRNIQAFLVWNRAILEKKVPFLVGVQKVVIYVSFSGLVAK